MATAALVLGRARARAHAPVELTPPLPSSDCPQVHAGSIYSACWSADSTKIFTCSGDGTAKVFQVPSLNEEAVISFPEAEATGPAKQLVGCAWAAAGLLTYSLGGILSLRTNAADAAAAVTQVSQSVKSASRYPY